MTTPHILMVEDNEGDAILTTLAVKSSRIGAEIQLVGDGIEATDYLYRRGRFSQAKRPDLILLDLNLPRMDGREVLAQIKADPELRTIPVVVLTGSDAIKDVHAAYDLHANCYVVKPTGAREFDEAVKAILSFWLGVAKLPAA
jgi:CheY-like chemotaxis protein